MSTDAEYPDTYWSSEAPLQPYIRWKRTAEHPLSKGWGEVQREGLAERGLKGADNSAGKRSHDDRCYEQGQDPHGHEASHAVIHVPTLGSRR